MGKPQTKSGRVHSRVVWTRMAPDRHRELKDLGYFNDRSVAELVDRCVEIALPQLRRELQSAASA